MKRWAAVLAALVVSACATTDLIDRPPAYPSPMVEPPQPARASGAPGDVVRSDLLAQVDPAITALGASQFRISYVSTSGLDDRPVTVSGSLFVPAGPAPDGGWPIVTVGHGTTGVTDECAPSLYPNLLGNVSMVTPALERGAVVVMSDFQGLGTDGPHPYLDPASAAYDMIDAVRAARTLVPGASTRWGAIGTSQGGQASWAAAERASTYGDGLEFVGAANLSPAADLTRLFEGNSLALSVPQKALIPFVFEGFRARSPEVNESDYLHGAVADNKATLMECTGPMAAEKFLAAASIQSEDTEPSTPTARDAIADWLREGALPQSPASGPMMTLVGGRDNLVLPEWTENATRAACALGDTIDFRLRPDQGHADGAAVAEGIDWLADRFAGVPPATTCGSVP